ncbi:inhibitor of growth protein 4 [Mytilus galloprovincialis]|uniref:Inhibitor of growth protein n=1 Tax=Mytilus galloprovincialis TaxID=29158 RepID=A0A8B6D991_MYTGA|nr:inhibitor of growth protein 4 [Mytilus galloprovincialis]
MATAMYLEHYLDSLETLPSELQRNFNLMRDLDQRAQVFVFSSDKSHTDYILDKVFSSFENVEGLKILKKLKKNANVEFLDLGNYPNKLSILMTTKMKNEIVDKHIRKLDADLARFEADLKEKSSSSSQHKGDSDSGKKLKGKEKKKRKSMKEEFEDEIPRKKKKKGAPLSPEPEAAPITVPLISITHPSDVLDMPVDPNEPTYCLCHQVSYGEMIGCDNADCPIEWFHFACVGLTIKPKGKWFCPRCSEERKKK